MLNHALEMAQNHDAAVHGLSVIDERTFQSLPAERILQYTRQQEIDVVVIGTRGRSDHERYVRLGSVTQRVVENAGVPVFVVHM